MGNNLPVPPSLASLLASSPLALFLDFDGTLVEIANSPDAIAVPERLGKRLEGLAARLDGAVAVITGRSIENLSQFIGQADLHLAGSHGGHVRAPNGDALLEAKGIPRKAQEAIDRFARDSGLLFERKAHGAALHYRAKPQLEEQAHAFARSLAEKHGLGTKIGKCVIEIVRPSVNKGSAVKLLAQRKPFVGATPVFIGDDVTDEDGFAACNQLGGFGILVGQRVKTAAQYRLEDVGSVHAWLAL